MRARLLIEPSPRSLATRSSAADLATVIFCNHEAGRAWPPTRHAVRPRAELFRIRRIAGPIVRTFARVLNADKHGLFVRSDKHAGDLAQSVMGVPEDLGPFCKSPVAPGLLDCV